MNIRLSNGIDLPKEIVEGFINAENKKLCVVYLDNEEKMHIRELCTTEYDLKLIQQRISENRWDDTISDFMVMDAKGEILFVTKEEEFKTRIDKNEYIYVNEDKLVVHAYSDGFIHGKVKEDVDRNYRHVVKCFFMDMDKNFGENGFTTNNKSRGIRELMDKNNDKSDPRD